MIEIYFQIFCLRLDYINFKEKIITVKAVSYTHLDVYKRQVHVYAFNNSYARRTQKTSVQTKKQFILVKEKATQRKW